MSRTICEYRYPEGHRCSSDPTEHVHQPPGTCQQGERHHDFTTSREHVHDFRCVECGRSPS